ncbi:decaprenylphospho-beta-D-erythro-pentofuranosid-2-ulose 2-reductase [Streptacidiphilus sp. MAP12-16]|uniref:SDR family NAD(P)-dependent oxidoreductase n=1 Tax=Streptacidiphilus sp. MAP12-16 TaxID=3156300 RepID=UPI003514056D
MIDALGRPGRVLLLGGTSEIGLAILAALPLSSDTEVLLAGRDGKRLAELGSSLPCPVRILYYDATAVESHQAFADEVFAGGDVDIAVSAAGILVPQSELDRDPLLAATLVDTNFTGHVSTLLAVAGHMRAQGHGALVVLSSVAAVRPRRANFVYGAAKAGLDAFAQGLADSLRGSGVRLMLVRPGFVVGRMTAGMAPAPLATTPEAVAAAVADGLVAGAGTVWVPGRLALLAVLMRLVPRPLWRRLSR